MLPEPFRAMDPADNVAWLAVADWLEENNHPERAELLRLTRTLTGEIAIPDRGAKEKRIVGLIDAGVEPCVITLRQKLKETVGRKQSFFLDLVYIPAGQFLMGSPMDETGRDVNDQTVRRAEISTGFYLGKYSVTQRQYRAVTGDNPSRFPGRGNSPVECVSAEEALLFCELINDGLSVPGWYFSLPTEEQWEYACRAGTTTPFHYGSSLSGKDAAFDGRRPYGLGEKGRSQRRPQTVGRYRPNAFGLYDMHGNIWDWCADPYQHLPPSEPPAVRVIRGGCWALPGHYCRSASRYWGPSNPTDYVGFRVALLSDKQSGTKRKSS